MDEPTRAALPPPNAPRKRKRRRKAKPGDAAQAVTGADPSAHVSVEESARRVLVEIDRLVARVTRDLGVPLTSESEAEPPEVSLLVPVPLLAPGDVAKRAAVLLADVRERVSAATASTTAFIEGHVYCFQTNTPDSVYSRPPRNSDVFAGYLPTGKPEWVSFANLCIARKEPRVDRLYGDSPEVLAFVQGPGELDEGLLPSFGRDSLVY